MTARALLAAWLARRPVRACPLTPAQVAALLRALRAETCVQQRRARSHSAESTTSGVKRGFSAR